MTTMSDHVRILGILHIVFGVLGLLIAVILFGVFGVGAMAIAMEGDPDAAVAAPIMGGIGLVVCGLVAVFSIPGIAAGFGLLKYRGWARILALVISALNILSVPIGTALGIYGFWVLLQNESEAMFRSPQAYAAPPPAPPGPAG
jgi:hypothetical protein